MYQVSEQASWRMMGDTAVIVNVSTGAYYSLNATASEIWQNVAAGKSEEDILQILLESYAIDAEQLRADISECVREWSEEGLISGAGVS